MSEKQSQARKHGLRDQLRRLNEYRTGERYIPAGADHIPGATPPTVPFTTPPFEPQYDDDDGDAEPG